MDDNKPKQDLGACAFDLPNAQNPRPHFKAYYGSTPVPHPTNRAAKVVHPDMVMRAVIEGK